jgi:uncharacterized protein
LTVTFRDRVIVLVVCVLLVGGGILVAQLPTIGAGALLHPARQRTIADAPEFCNDAWFNGAGVTLTGWRCRSEGARRGTVVYLHGIADNRSSGAGVVHRFVRNGFDVVAYDSRAHGDSDGPACTYGFYEKQDLQRVLDTVAGGPVVVVGTSLGAAVALQAAAVDKRVSAVVAAEVFSDLESIARERAPFIFTDALIREALRVAGEQGQFDVTSVSPVRAAGMIDVPVLVVHGAADVDTKPEHSQRVYDALRGPKRLIIVPGAGHNASLNGRVWAEIEGWIDTIVPTIVTRGARDAW